MLFVSVEARVLCSCFLVTLGCTFIVCLQLFMCIENENCYSNWSIFHTQSPAHPLAHRNEMIAMECFLFIARNSIDWKIFVYIYVSVCVYVSTLIHREISFSEFNSSAITYFYCGLLSHSLETHSLEIQFRVVWRKNLDHTNCKQEQFGFIVSLFMLANFGAIFR